MLPFSCCQSAGSFADRLSVLWFYHNPFLSFIAGNSVVLYCYVVFNPFFLLLLMLTRTFLSLLHLYQPQYFCYKSLQAELYQRWIQSITSAFSSSYSELVGGEKRKKKKKRGEEKQSFQCYQDQEGWSH